jgi:hypothetical protein
VLVSFIFYFSLSYCRSNFMCMCIYPFEIKLKSVFSEEFPNNWCGNQLFSLTLNTINVIKVLKTKQSWHLCMEILGNLNEHIHMNMAHETVLEKSHKIKTEIESASSDIRSMILMLSYLIFS